ncbi:hypothetical protein DFH08DRAFT_827046 [Mycena albidolilacea]|uniref:MYND-type domain-containing protein n=1 Tax=Mycena albidolilacea TaxID=1033008 RepID=A0AAD6YYT2_9AGAR|nr:hypothetical protein DFH08DRAFT_827046 [Mycena albidolilacea]
MTVRGDAIQERPRGKDYRDVVVVTGLRNKSMVCNELIIGARNNVSVKSEFQKCSGWLSLYYCGQTCQTLDWIEGGHRRACKSYRTLSLRGDSDLELTTRERSFLWVLIHHDYQNLRAILFFQQMAFMRVSCGEGFLVRYDYTKGPVNINLQLLRLERRLYARGPGRGRVEGDCLACRAQRMADDPRCPRVQWPTWSTVPRHSLRSNETVMYNVLRTLADELPVDQEA